MSTQPFGTPSPTPVGSDSMTGASQSGVAKKVDEAATKLGQKLSAAAESLRARAPEEGRMASAVNSLTDGLEQSGAYLQEQGVSGTFESLETTIRRYPVQALLIGLVTGYLLSRLRTR